MSPRGLGRGLSALIPGASVPTPPPTPAAPPAPSSTGVLVVDVARIHPNPKQPRRSFPTDELAALAASLKEHGVLQPLVVTARPDGEYELVAGERRLRAARIAGLRGVPVVVREGDDDRTKLVLALVENIQREDLNPIDRAQGYRQLHAEFGLTQEEVGRRVGVARSSVAHALRLLALPSDMQDALRRGSLTEGHGKILASMEDPQEQRAWFMRITSERLPVAAVERGRRDAIRAPAHPASGSGTMEVNLRARELDLQRALGAKVAIARKGSGGTITIAYGDAEELSGIVRKITRG